MNCPACGHELTEMHLGGVTVDACHGGCGGIWFDAFELQRVDEPHEVPGENLLRVQRDPALQVDHSRKRPCPRCAGVKLKRHFYSARKEVEMDHCPNCGGYWLDAGELEKIRTEKAHAAGAAQVRGPGVSIEAVRFLYRLRISRRTEP